MKRVNFIIRAFVLVTISTLVLYTWSGQSLAWGDPGRYLCVDFEVTDIDADVFLARGEFIVARDIEVTIENKGVLNYQEDRQRWPKTVSLIFMDGRGRGPADGMPYLKKVRTIRGGRAAVYSIPDHTIGPPYIQNQFPNSEITLYAEVDVGDVARECDEDNNYLEEVFEL